MNCAVALVDCNNFYVSCERLFAPRLLNRPVVVLSNNDGIIVSRSNEAKALGIKMATPLFEVRDIVEREGVIVMSSNYELYFDMRDRVRACLARFTPGLEKYSIDECFLDLSPVEPKQLDTYGRLIKKTVEQWTGIPVCVGIAETKCLAKLSNKLAKKSKKARGVIDLFLSPHRERALAQTPVEDLWGVGSAYGHLLQTLGIKTALDFERAQQNWVRKAMTVVGSRIQLELKGIPCIALELIPPPKEQLDIAQGFGVLVETLEEMREAARFKGAALAARARKEGRAIKELTVWIQTNPFSESPQYSEAKDFVFPVATQDTGTLIRAVERMVAEIYKPGFGYKRIGIGARKLEDANSPQLRLWGSPTREKKLKLWNLMDQINAQEGPGTLRPASVVKDPIWGTKFDHQSPGYTTDPLGIPTAKCG